MENLWKNQLRNITDISHSVFHFGDGLTMSQHPMPIMPLPLWVYTKDICTRLVGCCVFWGIFCIVLGEDGLVNIVSDVSPEYSTPRKFQPTKELWIDSSYLEYCSFVFCVESSRGQAKVGCIVYCLVISCLIAEYCLKNWPMPWVA